MAPPETTTTDGATKQEHAVEQLKIANYYLRVALDQVPNAVLIFEAQPLEGAGPRVIFSNTPAACLTGADPAKGLRGLQLNDLTGSEADAEILRSALQQAASEGSAECECDVQTFYGTGPKRCRWSIRAVTNSMKKLLNFTVTFSGVAQGVAAVPAAPERKTEDLDAQTERMRTENLATLAKGIAHDVNNLLGPIAARLSEIIPSLPQDSPLAEQLTLAFAGVKRAKLFTSQVVRVSRAKPGKREPSDLSVIIPDTVQLSQAGANVSVRTHVPEDLDWPVADAVRISQVLQNLVMNGIQAMPHGGYMDVEAKNIIIQPGKDIILKPGRYVELIVRDRGTGIAPENLERLFHEMFTTKADGNGIGLTTCKRFVEENEGDIRVSSKVNVGTEFRVLLPSVPRPVTAQPKGHSGTTAAPLPLQKGTGTVLIVDDEDELRRIAAAILRRCGYSVFDCDNGQEAVEIYKHLARQGSAPDAVLMDLTLRGGMSGTETTAEILRFDPNARVVVTSGSVSEDIQMAFLDQGFIDVLSKPYEAGELSMMVKKITTMPAMSCAA